MTDRSIAILLFLPYIKLAANNAIFFLSRQVFYLLPVFYLIISSVLIQSLASTFISFPVANRPSKIHPHLQLAFQYEEL